MAQHSKLCNREQQQISIARTPARHPPLIFNKIAKQLYPLFVLALLSNAVRAASDAQAEIDSSNTFFSIQYENDLFSPNNGDRYYTSGIQLTMLKKQESPTWLTKVAKWTPFYQQGNELNLVKYTVGQKMFTPDDIEAFALQVNDRPYAGYLYFGASVMSQLSHTKNVDHGNQFEITLGLIGPSALAEEVQTFGHKLTSSPIPNGWHNQLKDELALGLSYSRFWRRVKPLSDGLQFGVNPQVSAAVGNVYTYGAVGVMFRLGKNLRQDLSPPNIRPGFPGVTYFKKRKQFNWYVYLGAESRLVFRNIFLDGNTFADSHKVEKEPLVGDIQYGLVFIIDNMRIALSSLTRTDEYTTQKEITNYGAINFSFQY